MRFVDEFRDPAAARSLLTVIEGQAERLGRPLSFMEVCGGHTHTIYRHGLEHLLPESIQLVHGPGCPVCVIPMGRVDDAVWLAHRPGVIFTTFGDMMRVPGTEGSLLQAQAARLAEDRDRQPRQGGRVLRRGLRDDGPLHRGDDRAGRGP